MVEGTTRHALITGGSSGIGLAVAEQLASEGWNLSLIARGQDGLERARDRLLAVARSDVQRVMILPADVASPEATTVAVDAAIGALGAPDLVITSAGVARPGRFGELALDIFRQAMDVNYFGTLHTVMAVLPAMQSRRAGKIVMLSSAVGLIGIFGYSAYAPSKFAVRGLAETLRAELVSEGIGVSVVYPPDTDTPQLTMENQYKPSETKKISGLARAWKPDDVARVILDGVRRDRFIIAPGVATWLLSRLHSLLGSFLRHKFDGLAASARPRADSRDRSIDQPVKPANHANTLNNVQQ